MVDAKVAENEVLAEHHRLHAGLLFPDGTPLRRGFLPPITSEYYDGDSTVNEPATTPDADRVRTESTVMIDKHFVRDYGRYIPGLAATIEEGTRLVKAHTGDAVVESAASGCGADELKGSLFWGLDVTVSAALSLKLPGVLKKLDKTFAHWGPKTVYHMPRKTLDSKCFDV